MLIEFTNQLLLLYYKNKHVSFEYIGFYLPFLFAYNFLFKMNCERERANESKWGREICLLVDNRQINLTDWSFGKQIFLLFCVYERTKCLVTWHSIRFLVLNSHFDSWTQMCVCFVRCCCCCHFDWYLSKERPAIIHFTFKIEITRESKCFRIYRRLHTKQTAQSTTNLIVRIIMGPNGVLTNDGTCLFHVKYINICSMF